MQSAATNEVQVPYSSGTEFPKLKAPPNACDCHHHLFDTRVPSVPPTAARPDVTVADYRLLQKRIGTSRNVVVTASNYGTNNQVTTDAIELIGASSRGIAVVDVNVTVAELKRLDDQGVRGIRISRSRVAYLNDIKTLSKRVADLGWHIQFNLRIEDVVAAEGLLSELPSPIVFDNLACIDNVNDPALNVIKRLLDNGRTWVKLAGVHVTSKGDAPTYADSVAVAKAYVKAAPQRLVWGSGWPHTSGKFQANDAQDFDLNLEWAPDAATQELILVRNPETMYGFAKTA